MRYLAAARAVVYILALRVRGNGEVTTLSSSLKRVAFTGVALAALCGVVACATGPGRTEAQRDADRATAARVQAALLADRALYANHISVNVHAGVVRLSGYVWDPPDLDEARSVAELVPGVTRVVNDLELERNTENSPAVR